MSAPVEKESSALARAGAIWKFAAVLWSTGDQWRGRASWEPERVGAAGQAMLEELCRRGRLSRESKQ